ncbi:unnamed protein product [[Candida] boidinii]|nr:unnamed protein product [[Candida] boidinii]
MDATVSVHSSSDIANTPSHLSTKEQLDEIKQNGAENFELYLEAQNLSPEEIEQAGKKVLRSLIWSLCHFYVLLILYNF